MTLRGENSFLVAIKYMHLGAADGAIDKITLTISILRMSDEQFVVKEIQRAESSWIC